MTPSIRLSKPVIKLVVVLLAGAFGLAACGGGGQPSAGVAGPAAPKRETDAALQQLRSQAGQLIAGGPTAFRARLAGLRGVPVVVNQWASWCGPCRFEFPFFQRLANGYRGQVAFLGVDSNDARSDAVAFLKGSPVPYPHFYDGDVSIARTFGGGRGWPTTAFFAPSGRLAYTHIGSYATQAKLNADIARFALHG